MTDEEFEKELHLENEIHIRTKYIILIMKAFLDGKTIQYFDCSKKEWIDIEKEPVWGWSRLNYRIKPDAH